MTEDNSTRGLIAVDKQGDRLLFLDPKTLEIIGTIEDMPTLPHELAISGDRAYVPAYGSGVHGDNPHPNHVISVVDLGTRQRLADIDLIPLESPHTLKFGPDGLLYVACENSAAVAIIQPASNAMVGRIDTGSRNSHRLTILPGRRLICTDNEEDKSISVIDLESRTLRRKIALPDTIAGIAHFPDEMHIAVTSADAADLLIVDVDAGVVVRRLPLKGHEKGSQVVRFSPDGRWLLVIGDHEPVVSLILATDLAHQLPVPVGQKPMDAAFHPDGRTLLVANEDSATLTEIHIETGTVLRTVSAGKGCETLAYF